MFDAHAHPGIPTAGALVCSAGKEDYPRLLDCPYRAAGLLPGRKPDWDALENALKAGCILGEVGLDKRFPDLDEQRNVLLKALEIGKGLPVVLHTVRAWQDMLEIISNHPGRYMLHGWTGSYEMAKRFLDKGCLISLGPRAERVRDFNRLLTLPFVTETDLPSGEEQQAALKAWNIKLSELTGLDIEARTERMMKEWL